VGAGTIISGSVSLTSTDTAFVHSVTGLELATAYRVYIVLVDLSPFANQDASVVVSPLSTTTIDAPTFLAGTPASSSINQTGFAIDVVVSKDNSVVWLVVVNHGFTAPTTSELLLGAAADGQPYLHSENHTFAAAGDRRAFTVSNDAIVAGTKYDVYLIAKHMPTAIMQPSFTMVSITTLSPSPSPPPSPPPPNPPPPPSPPPPSPPPSPPPPSPPPLKVLRSPVVAATLTLTLNPGAGANSIFDAAAERNLLAAAAAAAADAMKLDPAAVIVRVKSYAVAAVLRLPVDAAVSAAALDGTAAAAAKTNIAAAVAFALGVPAARVTVVSLDLATGTAGITGGSGRHRSRALTQAESSSTTLVKFTVLTANAAEAGGAAAAVSAVARNGSLALSLRRAGVLPASTSVSQPLILDAAPTVVAELEVVVESGAGVGGLANAVASGAFSRALALQSNGSVSVGAAEVRAASSSPPPSPPPTTTPATTDSMSNSASSSIISSRSMWTIVVIAAAAAFG
jgi:hypothetical protein